jgi:hypothetical protein
VKKDGWETHLSLKTDYARCRTRWSSSWDMFVHWTGVEVATSLIHGPSGRSSCSAPPLALVSPATQLLARGEESFGVQTRRHATAGEVMDRSEEDEQRRGVRSDPPLTSSSSSHQIPAHKSVTISFARLIFF